MNLLLYCYVSRKKIRGLRISEAFVAARDGQIVRDQIMRAGEIAYWGMNDWLAPVWPARLAADRWFYLDNGYLKRGHFFRVTVNGEQIDGIGKGSEFRFHRMTVHLNKKWRKDGRYILICPPGDEYMRCRGLSRRGWFNATVSIISRNTDRPIRIRDKPQRGAQPPPLADDLADAFAVVTYTSNVAIDALLAGVPVFVNGPSAARPMAESDFAKIETPIYPDGRHEWARWLAANQWSEQELRAGKHWRFWLEKGLIDGLG